MKKEYLYKRQFLNKKGYQSTAFIYSKIYRSGDGALNVDLKMGDCDRVVSFDFNTWNEQEWKNSLHKAKLLADGIQEFTKALQAAYEDRK